MAAGAITLFNIAKKKLFDGTLDLDTNTFKLALTTSAQALTAAFAGTSTDCRYSDLTGELATANGYTAGGATMGSITLAQASGTVTWDAADTVLTLTNAITFRYGVIYASSVTNSPLLGYFLADSTPADVTPLAGTLTFQWNALGLLTAA